MGLIGCFGLAFASAFTALSLGLAVGTLLLLVLLLLARPLLVAPVWVAMLALHRTDLVSVVLLGSIVDRVCLELRDYRSAHITED